MSRNSLLAWSEVDLNILRGNLRAIRSSLKKSKAEILAIVKADAYGHGMKAVAQTLARQGVNFFGVANIDEALELRGCLPRSRILVLGSFHYQQAPWFIQKNITPTISSWDDFTAIEKCVKKIKKRFAIHVKIDTGMGRLGMPSANVDKFFRKIKNSKHIFVEGVYTHFSRSDHEEADFTHRQIHFFEKLVEKIKSLGFSPRYIHAANSMGLVRFKEAHLNLVRPGIILYGINPLKGKPLPIGVRPILSWRTRISFLKDVEKGTALSYGGTYETPGKTRIATAPIGYSHGYRVGFSNKSSVLVRGKKCPVVGRVTMDQLLIDVGALPEVKRWDEVTLIGQDGRAQIQASELAVLIDTIPYEIVCSIHSRIPRIYKGMR